MLNKDLQQFMLVEDRNFSARLDSSGNYQELRSLLAELSQGASLNLEKTSNLGALLDLEMVIIFHLTQHLKFREAKQSL